MKYLLFALLLILTAQQSYSNCIIVDLLNKQCLICSPGYQLTNYLCINCAVGYAKSSNGLCLPIQQVNNSSLPLLTKIVSGFTLEANPCNSLDSNQNCIGCINGFTLLNGKCISSSQNGTANNNASLNTSSTSNLTKQFTNNTTSAIVANTTTSNNSVPTSPPLVTSSAPTATPNNLNPGTGVPPQTATGQLSKDQLLSLILLQNIANIDSSNKGSSNTAAVNSGGSTSNQISASPLSSGTTIIYSSSSTPASTPAPTSTSTATSTSSNIGKPPIPLVSLTSTSQNFTNCAQYDPLTLLCLKCYFSYHLDSNSNNCIPNDPLCSNYTSDYLCASCYLGYLLNHGLCTSQDSSNDPYCKIPGNLTCEQCYNGYYPNPNTKLCTVANQQCKTRDNLNNCTSCYTGYTLINGTCINSAEINDSQTTLDSNNTQNSNIYTNTITTKANSGTQIFYPSYIPIIVSGSASSGRRYSYLDPNCHRFKGRTCVQCNTRTFPSSGLCTQVDPNCNTYDNITGACTSCYLGYSLTAKFSCVIAAENRTKSACYFRMVFSNGKCVQVNDQCRTWNMITGLCIGCYFGYRNVEGDCISTFT